MKQMKESSKRTAVSSPFHRKVSKTTGRRSSCYDDVVSTTESSATRRHSIPWSVQQTKGGSSNKRINDEEITQQFRRFCNNLESVSDRITKLQNETAIVFREVEKFHHVQSLCGPQEARLERIYAKLELLEPKVDDVLKQMSWPQQMHPSWPQPSKFTSQRSSVSIDSAMQDPDTNQSMMYHSESSSETTSDPSGVLSRAFSSSSSSSLSDVSKMFPGFELSDQSFHDVLQSLKMSEHDAFNSANDSQARYHHNHSQPFPILAQSFL